ncbi:MAG: flippase-like domain-containing protein [Planctomycetales bacterium]|nr:flippase-like domain-containing protein [Planctomycetales bacterium]
MGLSRRSIKTVLQLVVLGLVVWGIASSVRKSAAQLASQRAALGEQAAELRRRAAASDDPREQQRWRSQALARERAARLFWQAHPAGLLAAGGLYALGMLPASLFWRQCLKAMDQPIHLPSILWAYFYGNLGKYFPGKAMVIVLRLAALQPLGIHKTATSITIFMETLTMMSVGGAIGAVCMILLNLDWRLTLLAVGLLAATFIPTYPPLLRWGLPRLQRGVAPEVVASWAARIDGQLFVRGWLLLTLTWIAFGLSLIVVLCSLPVANFGETSWSTTLLSCFGAIALAVVLGFVSLLPGGAGVREAVLSLVLTPVVGPIAALCGAVWLRCVWLATELLMAGFLFMVQRFLPSPPREPPR